MDLHFSGHQPSPSESQAVDLVLGPPPDEAGPRRDLLLPVLHSIQSRMGWISPGALNYACQRLQIPPAEAHGVASFYHLFSLQERSACTVHVCDDLACRLRGADQLCDEIERMHGPENQGEAAAWRRSPCLGLCERAPAAFVQQSGEDPFGTTIAPADAESIGAVLRDPASARRVPLDSFSPAVSLPQLHQPGLRLLKGFGEPDPLDFDAYRSRGGYTALALALQLGPEAVVQEVSESGLVGRGGAAFPSGRKWHAVAMAPAPRYLVCNADESEPGTFKDRLILEGDPFLLIEAMTIAAFATGCQKGYLYIRGEYALAIDRMQRAVASAREQGLLGDRILGHDLKFDIEIRRGAGAYICGEETALFNSIEGYRGEPRSKPPFPTQRGLFGRPTVVNNVETLANVPYIVLHGATNFSSAGTAHSNGHKLYCVSGHVARPGLYEFPFGITLRKLIEEAGGVAGSGRLQAVLVGGAAGAFLSPGELDTPLTFEGLRAAGTMLGSAVVMPMDDTVDLRAMLHRIASFFRDESCGQCVPCRIGTVRLREMTSALTHGSAPDNLLLRELAQAMRDASICGLGQTAPNALESALLRFPGLTEGARP